MKEGESDRRAETQTWRIVEKVDDMSNVGGSAGESGFDFQARLIALTSVYILAQRVFTALGRELEGIPTAVAAETNGPGDDIQIEFTDNGTPIEIQAKKGLRVDPRFSETLDKIASGLVQNPSLNVILAVDPKTSKRLQESLSHDLKRLRQGRTDVPRDLKLLNLALGIFKKYATSDEHARELLKHLFIVTFDIPTKIQGGDGKGKQGARSSPSKTVLGARERYY